MTRPAPSEARNRLDERSPFDAIRPVADAVLYEGYVLYPYRASSAKNQTRWQFGVLMPPAFVAADASERAVCRTALVFEAKPHAAIQVEVRFLHVQHRSGGGQPDWDETVEQQVDLTVPVASCRDQSRVEVFAFAGSGTADASGVRRQISPVSGTITVRADELPGPYGALRLSVEVANTTEAEPGDRDEALRSSLVATHTLLAIDRGKFLSMTDPPEWARPAVEACANEGTWPVLGDGDRVVLSSPIILGDHPQVAPESPGDLYDATEIDEILTLRTMTLTDAEKAEARATDPRAAAVIDQVDGLPPEHLDRLHGALRYLRTVTGEPELPTDTDTPWWDPGADSSVSPEQDAILIDGVWVRRGSRVVLRPGHRRTDAQDLFMIGRTATVEAVFFDVDGEQHVGVVPDDDPELAEISRAQGRFFYYAPDEVSPIDAGSPR